MKNLDLVVTHYAATTNDSSSELKVKIRTQTPETQRWSLLNGHKVNDKQSQGYNTKNKKKTAFILDVERVLFAHV